MKKQVIAGILSFSLVTAMFPLSGCRAEEPVQAADLMAGIQANPIHAETDLTDGNQAFCDFAVRLFQQSMEEDKNTLISPLSVLCALAMTANGAEGNTLSQMEEVLGLPVSDLNAYLYAYTEGLSADENSKLSIANSIWLKNDGSLQVEPDFLQANADWYGAGLYQAPFDDSTLKEINDWVSDHTDGLIQDILDRIPEDTVMYLINALALDAEWQEVYQENQVRQGTFTKEDGTEQDAEMMYSTEYQFLTDDNATGFIKYYAGQKYAFAALLPNEGVRVADYAASLTGEKIDQILTNAQNVAVDAAIPKFTSAYSVEMKDILTEMGMPDAFDAATADFSGIGTSPQGNLYINRVLHKTFIAVDEKGTKAGAATVVEMNAESAMVEPEIVQTVHLDRPFVYMLIDCQTNTPVFMGTVMDIAQ
ncbi:MAG TPA: serpin family protein [Firmicutes bacterium]|nr:serpin family protein [Bacillota bacterium]